MRLDTLFATAPVLLEMDWYDVSPLVRVLRANRGRWVHFTFGAPNRTLDPAHAIAPPPLVSWTAGAAAMRAYRRRAGRVAAMNADHAVPKLGINPNFAIKPQFRRSGFQHGDPPGVYFYPVDYLLSATERLRLGQQYKLDAPFYYICDIALNAGGVNLRWVKWPEVEAIADRNGWRPAMDAFRALPEAEQRQRLPNYADIAQPGSFLYHFVETLVKAGTLTWRQAFRGLSYLRDENQAIIHSNEPDQLVVFDPRIITVVQQGENVSRRNVERDQTGYYLYAVTNILKAVRGEFGGELHWDKQLPILEFSRGPARFTGSFTQSGGLKNTLSFSYWYGRAEGGFYYHDQLHNWSSEQIVDDIVRRVRRIAARTTDLPFTPVLSERVAAEVLRNRVGVGQDLALKTTVHVDGGSYNALFMRGLATVTHDRIEVETRFFLHDHPDHFTLGVEVRLDGRAAFGRSLYGDEYRSEAAVGEALAELTAELAESLEQNVHSYRPEATLGYPHRHFGDQDSFTAFVGWLVLNCGLSLDGGLQNRFADEIAAYRAFPDKRVLHSDIAYVIHGGY